MPLASSKTSNILWSPEIQVKISFREPFHYLLLQWAAFFLLIPTVQFPGFVPPLSAFVSFLWHSVIDRYPTFVSLSRLSIQAFSKGLPIYTNQNLSLFSTQMASSICVESTLKFITRQTNYKKAFFLGKFQLMMQEVKIF